MGDDIKMKKNKLLILSDLNLNPMVRFLEGSFADFTLEVTEIPLQSSKPGSYGF